jgi:hypothetical protein
MEPKRDNIVGLIIGGRGRRKTTFVKDLIWKIKDKRRIVIVDTFDNSVWRNMGTVVNGKPLIQERAEYAIPVIDADQLYDDHKGIFRIYSSEVDEMLTMIQERCRNTMVIVEDANRFLESNLDASMRSLILDTKQTNVDLFFVFHSLRDTPPRLCRWADTLTLFKTQEKWNSSLENKFPNPAVEALFKNVADSNNEFVNKTCSLRG